MSASPAPAVSVAELADEDRELVRLAAVVAAADEDGMRRQLASAVVRIRPQWIEELLLQSYLFAGFPRSLNAMREWRRLSKQPAAREDSGEHFDQFQEWTSRGERTCETVYGEFYQQLRRNIRDLHPALDAWMIVEGYGKVLSRPGLDLARRELCIVAACAAARQDRQLHSHLHGALHAGAAPRAIAQTLDAISAMLSPADLERYRLLWTKVNASNEHVH